MKRREFLINSCAACLSVTAIASLLPSCGSSKFISGKLNNDGLLLNVDEFISVKNKKTSFHQYLIVRNEELKYPICVYRISDTEYKALWMQCTHQGTELQVAGNYLHCPAHGSEFNDQGKVFTGPAAIDLRSFPVLLTNNQLFIDLRKK
jgi:Rieske Fe-S protein